MVLRNGNTPKITAQAIAGAVHSQGSHQRRYMAAPLAPGAGPGRTALASRRARDGAAARCGDLGLRTGHGHRVRGVRRRHQLLCFSISSAFAWASLTASAALFLPCMASCTWATMAFCMAEEMLVW